MQRLEDDDDSTADERLDIMGLIVDTVEEVEFILETERKFANGAR